MIIEEIIMAHFMAPADRKLEMRSHPFFLEPV
jgi:hypothetical protein